MDGAPRGGAVTAHERWLILADDLTGAADAAIAFARRGVHTEVGWGECNARDCSAAAVFAYDCDSRRLGAQEAALRQLAVATRLFERRPDSALFKKIDSTLRGQPAAEIAALCAVLRDTNKSVFGIFAPANPSMGRTTRDGRVFVHGEPLEDSETWRREHSYPSADLAAIVASAGLHAVKLPLAQLRAGEGAVRAALSAAAGTSPGATTILVCDAETDDDLACIAALARATAMPDFFIGTAGLANALAQDVPRGTPQSVSLAASRHGALIVVGSLASASRTAARELAASAGVRHVLFTSRMLLADDARTRTNVALDIRIALERGTDVLVEMPLEEDPDLSAGPALVRSLAMCLSPAYPRMSGLIVTGGETAAALLRQCYVARVRLVDEIEAGTALGVMVGEMNVPLITKPGAFGDSRSLIRSLERLRSIRKTGTLA